MTRIDRRALFTSGAAAALLAASGISADAQPRAGGTLRLALPRDGSLDTVVRGATVESLTEIAPDGILRGTLATAWEPQGDARSWHFGLTEAARFHDDSPVLADHAARALAAADLPGLLSVRTEGRHRLRLDFDAPRPDLPIALAGQGIAPGGNSTGPYRIARMQPDRHALLVRVAGHHRAGRAGWAERVEIAVIPDAKVRAEALRDGFVDIAYLPDAEGVTGRDLLFHPSAQDIAIAARRGVGIPRIVGGLAPLDDGRIAERWWIA